MAYINGEWLDRPAREERIKLLERSVALYRQLARQGKLTAEDVSDFERDLNELERLKRVHRAEVDMLYFFYEYFSEARNPGNPGNLVPDPRVDMDDAPEFHRELCRLLDDVSNVNKTARIAWAAARGHAKSAYLSNASPLRELVYGKRRYILIVSETDRSAKKFVEWIRNELKFNQKLREDFGSLLEPRKTLNIRDNDEAFLTQNRENPDDPRNGILVEASSLGKQMRGKRNGPYRPDYIILDDLESDKTTNTAEMRAKYRDWFNQVLMPIGDPERTAVIFMGTVVHHDSLLNYVLNNRHDFTRRKFAAILSPPEREDLWQQFEEIYRSAKPLDGEEDEEAVENAVELAMKFYEQHKEEMDRGVKVLWPQRFPYPKLIIEKVNIGSKAFNSEFMNNPIDEESQIFKPDLFTFYDRKDINLRQLDIYGAWDIAMGKNDRSDYNAIVIVGRDRKSGIIYVLDAWAKKCPAHVALDAVVEKIREYSPRIFAVETVQAQHDFFRQLRERLPRERLYYTKLKPVIHRTKKEQRIESLEPLVESGALRFEKNQRLLLEQLEQFPSGPHDDLPDALQMAVDLCARNRKRTFYRKPAGL